MQYFRSSGCTSFLNVAIESRWTSSGAFANKFDVIAIAMIATSIVLLGMIMILSVGQRLANESAAIISMSKS